MNLLGDAYSAVGGRGRAATYADARARFNRTVLLAGASVTPVVAVIELVASNLDSATQTELNYIPYIIVVAVSLGQLRRREPNAQWLTYPVAIGLIALNIYELSSGSDIGGVSTGVTLAVVVVIAYIGAVLAPTRWLTWTAIMSAVVTGWGVWAGRMEGMAQTDSILLGVVPGVGILLGAMLIRWLVDQLQANADEATRLARFHEAIAECAEALGESNSLSPERALRALLEATNASSVFVTRNVDDPVQGLSMSMIKEVLADGMDEDPEGHWDLVPWTSVPHAFDSLTRGKPIYYLISDTTPEEQAMYEGLGVDAECNIPIIFDGEWRGVLGLCYTGTDYPFHETDFDLLTTAARIFGAHWKAIDQRAELEHLVRSKDELIAAVSHELRTPLTGVLGFAEAMLETTDGPGREFVELIADQSRDMADIIDDLLVTARVEVGNLVVAHEQLDLGDIVRSVVASSAIQAAASDTTVDVDAGTALAVGDPTRVRQIVRNLIANALRHGGRQVRVSLHQHESHSDLRVWDSGTMLEPEIAERLFERFYTGQRPRTQPGSVGLGLFLSRHLAQMMGGDLTVGVNASGTTFRLSLPYVGQLPVDMDVSEPPDLVTQ